MKKYTSEELWKLYEKIPQELKEAIFSEKTSEIIWDICLRNEVEDERISEIALYTGRVLLGILPPDEFQKTLEKEINIQKEVAKNIALEINRFIFYPVKPELEQLYTTEITPLAKPTEVTPPKEEKKPELKSEEISKEDVYREPIE